MMFLIFLVTFAPIIAIELNKNCISVAKTELCDAFNEDVADKDDCIENFEINDPFYNKVSLISLIRGFTLTDSLKRIRIDNNNRVS
jgi:hypothetical protein